MQMKLNWTLSAVITAILVLTGCGGGSSNDSSTTSSAQSTDTQASIIKPWMPADSKKCNVTYVYDGDTFSCTYSTDLTKDVFKVRVAGMDAPETMANQTYATQAKNLVTGLVDSYVYTSCYKTDVYGRQVCRVYTSNYQDLSYVMIASGAAWQDIMHISEQTTIEQATYNKAQYDAQQSKVGLWGYSNPMAPWICRTNEANNTPCT